MPFSFTPVNELDLFPDGDYDAVVLRAEEGKSQKGNNMLILTLRVYHPTGQSKLVTDYLIDLESVAWKTRHFCETAWLDYDAGTIEAEDIRDANVRVRVETEAAQNGYPAKNKVKDYLAKPDKSAAPQPSTPASQPFVATNDDIPFSVVLPFLPVLFGLVSLVA